MAGVAVVEPQELPEPTMTEGLMMDCAVIDQSGTVRYLRCLVSRQTGLAYTFVRTLRECIYGVVRHAVTLSQRDGVYHYHFDRQVSVPGKFTTGVGDGCHVLIIRFILSCDYTYCR